MNISELEKFIAMVDAMKKQDKMDLSSDQDLSIALMNLISIEEHFFFTGNKTDNPKYFDLINKVREVRKHFLKKIVKKPEGEVWCISKHLLAASMRLMEVGTKQLNAGKKDEAYDLFNKAYQMYSLFWGLNMGAITTENVKKIDEGAIDKNDQNKKGFMRKLGELARRALDCCME